MRGRRLHSAGPVPSPRLEACRWACHRPPAKSVESSLGSKKSAIYKANRQELCAFNVPRNCVDQVGKLINHLSTCTLFPHEIAAFDYLDPENEIKKMAFRLIKPLQCECCGVGECVDCEA